MNVLFSNPPGHKRKKGRKTKARTSHKKRASRNPPMAQKRKSRKGKRRTSRRGGGVSLRGFVNKDVLMTGGIAAVGIWALPKAIAALPQSVQDTIRGNPYITAAASAAIGLLAGMLLRKTSPTLAKGLAIGGVVAGGSVVLQQAMSGLSGNEWRPQLAGNEFRPQLETMSGMGDVVDQAQTYAA